MLDGGDSQNFPGLATPVTYTITEVIPPGSNLVITSNAGETGPCEFTVVTANNTTGVADIDLEGSCDLVITFTNTGNSTVTIEKDTIPTNNIQLFNFTSTLPGQANFGITSASGISVADVPGGTFVVQEEITPGYTLTNITCDDPDTTTNIATRTANINVSENENINCTFTNTANGTIIIEKETVPIEGMGFTFTENIPVGTGTFELDDGQSQIFNDVPPGEYTVTEDDPIMTPGEFFLSDIVCDDMGSSTNLETRTATIDLDQEETITCRFTNTTLLQGLNIIKTDSPDPVVAGQELTYDITMINESNFEATNVLLVDMLPDGVIPVDVFSNVQGVDCEFDIVGPLDPPMATCDIGNLQPEEELLVTVIVIPDPDVFDDAPVMIENKATLTAEPGGVVREATTQTLVNPMVDIEIDAGSENRSVGQGNTFQVSYDITVNPDNEEVLASLSSDDAQIRVDALDVMLDVDFPEEIEVDSVEVSQGMCTIGSVQCNFGDIMEGQTVTVIIIFIAPNERGDFTIGATVSTLGQSFSNFIFITVGGDGSSNCSLAPAGSRGPIPLYLFIPLFILVRRRMAKKG
ncbi:MAG: DUF11 domain-containing protein [Candidatus Dadabacteria bacterium]|nr:DUF11 domain-containing protein [Candidatus Dadabacteria bacterium]